MSRSDSERIDDILEAAAEVADVVARGKDVIGLRTVLAHHYHRVDPEQVWVIASDELPRLVDQLS